MSSEDAPPAFTPADRITQLSQIDSRIASLLSSAGQALQTLTSPPDSTNTTANPRETFQDSIQTYFSTLSAIDVGLRRQIYALQEAGLIQEGTQKDAKAAMTRTELRVGGNGGLETSWLNSRAKDQVGKGMEQELWARARKLLEGAEGKAQKSDDVKDQEGESMEIEQEEDNKQSGG